ncbi:MAG: DUF2779 domain-containing protein [Bacteroidota bacterium]
MRYLTKSRFKLALYCVTKLYYTRKKEYADESLDDPFLEALAEGGFQVGELAKYMFCDDPVAEDITIWSLDYDEALSATEERLKRPGKVVIAEAAFRHASLFIRADLVVKDGNSINLYEVKSKSEDDEPVDFITKRGAPKIATKWEGYLYDIAFQKYVASKALENQGLTIAAHLILVDKSTTATIDGLNQKFKILKQDGDRVRVEVEKGLTRAKLGDPILRAQNVDDEIQRIWDEFPVPTDYKEDMRFSEFVDFCSGLYEEDRRAFAPLGAKRKNCQFVNSPSSQSALKSGFHECWKHQTGYSDELLKKELAVNLWGGNAGGRSLVGDLIAGGKYLIESISESDIAPRSGENERRGLSPHQRRMEQITRVKSGKSESYFNKEGLAEEMESWVYPLHMIDFETTMTALPFHKGRHPYEGIAFQFSHHVIEENGAIRHAGQYLSFEPGVFPNYHFVRELKRQLERDNGSVFRYHNHENTYLGKIYDQLRTDRTPEPDKGELLSFIRDLTSLPTESGDRKGKQRGRRGMVDLYKVVVRYYYSPFTQGNNSLKSVLPAIIRDSEYLRSKYSKPVYGKAKEVKSLNFDEHIWIQERYGNDPYRTLKPLFDDYDIERLDRMLSGLGEIKDGGAAMTAYNCLQFSDVPQDQRIILRDGLLRYCELDTMAMVMLIEGWMNMG